MAERRKLGEEAEMRIHGVWLAQEWSELPKYVAEDRVCFHHVFLPMTFRRQKENR